MEKNNKIKIINCNELKEISQYLKENPEWISGFVNGEGSFTASFTVDIRATWGLVPQCEFNITQSMEDIILFKAINEYFNNIGGIYTRSNNIGTFSIRQINLLYNKIIPFFNENPLLGRKHNEFKKWCRLVLLLNEKKHLGISLYNRDIFIDFALICKELNNLDQNLEYKNNKKIIRINLIINWLKNLSKKPTIIEKKVLKNEIMLLNK